MDGTTNTTQNTKNTNVNNNVNTNTQSEPSSTTTTNATTELLPSNHHLQDLFNDDFVHKHGAMLHDCTVIIGMHPDQAAGPIVEFAVAFNKSFAVVPCCVYSDEFSKRKLQNGKRVTSYDDLCQYLIELAEPGEIQQCIIPHLKGKNVCLYRIVEGQ